MLGYWVIGGDNIVEYEVTGRDRLTYSMQRSCRGILTSVITTSTTANSASFLLVRRVYFRGVGVSPSSRLLFLPCDEGVSFFTPKTSFLTHVGTSMSVVVPSSDSYTNLTNRVATSIVSHPGGASTFAR